MSDPEIPEPDRVEGAPHPRETARLIGQNAAETTFLDALNAGRLHHGWLISGPLGVGKATLAWRIARYLIATPEDDGTALLGAGLPAAATLDIAPDHPALCRILAGSEPRLFLLRRAWDEEKKRFKSVITIDEVRRLKSFFQLSATDGGRRVAIIDSADEMNANAANALLKILEEPRAGVTLLLISHQPSGLLPTIRSRCRELRLSTLSAEDMAIALAAAGVEVGDNTAVAVLAGGSVGAAIRLSMLDGLQIYSRIAALFSTIPQLDRVLALQFAEGCVGRGLEPRFDLSVSLLDMFMARLARAGVTRRTEPEAVQGEAALFARLSPDPHAGRRWAELHQKLGARARHGRSVNLDPAALLLDMILKIDEMAAAIAACPESRT